MRISDWSSDVCSSDLEAESIQFESGAIRQLAKAADGSLRDGLSLLDQALAYTGAAAGAGKHDDAGVATMLGSVDRSRIGALLSALAAGDRQSTRLNSSH